MNPTEALDTLAERAGIVAVYQDLDGVERQTSRETKRALLRADGWQLDNDAMISEALRVDNETRRKRMFPTYIVGQLGKAVRVDVATSATWYVDLENTDSVSSEGRSDGVIILSKLPTGVHSLTIETQHVRETLLLIISPRTAPSVLQKTGADRIWGVNLALYGLHSQSHSGIGNYGDLALACEELASCGAGFVGINPAHAIGWCNSEVTSPYSPSHRGFLNTNHLACHDIAPISDRSQSRLLAWNNRGSINSVDLVDYDEHLHNQRPLLRALYDDFINQASPEHRAKFEEYCREGGIELQRFIEYESLSERLGANWHHWSAVHQNVEPGDPSLKSSETFHAWLQWQAENQLRAAQNTAISNEMALGLYLDLAVGSRRDGAEAWSARSSIADGVSIGAPPDHLSPAGQNWNLAAYSPRKLAADGYRAFRNILARNMRRCGLLRIDHILGLNRSFWIPDDGSPGGYMKQHFDALLAIVRIEAERAGTIIIGEDLGLVPDGFRKSLAQSGIYSYSVLQYEKTKSGRFRKPRSLRRQSLACFGTHDTPTLRGFCEGRDIDWWQKLGWIDESSTKDAKRNREAECADLTSIVSSDARSLDGKDTRSLDRSVHNALANSPATMVSVQLDDLEGRVDAQNLPGTIDEHPNWRRRHLTSAENLSHLTELRDLGKLMDKSGRNSGPARRRDKKK